MTDEARSHCSSGRAATQKSRGASSRRAVDHTARPVDGHGPSRSARASSSTPCFCTSSRTLLSSPGEYRILRNLIEASVDELRPERMPKILDDVHRVIRDGAIEEVASLNQAQVEDETRKAAFLASNPELQHAVFALEDHELLRGSICAFELDPAAFEARAATFRQLMSQPELWTDLLAALLAVGEYQRQRTNSRPFLFGTDSKTPRRSLARASDRAST